MIGVKVASHTDSHVIRDIPFIEVVLDIDDRRILQVLLCANRGLRTVWMVGPQHLTASGEELAIVA